MRKKILVVEDEQALLKAITMKMEKMGVDAIPAKSVEEAKKKIQEKLPDLVWLDHYLFGDEDGLDLLKYLKNQSNTKDIPVIVVSNTCSNDKYHDYINLGINKYFVKSSVRLDEIISEAMNI